MGINTSHSQYLTADLSFKYLYSKPWDKAIQTYNFSRPFIAEKQPVIANGVNASFAHLFKSKRKTAHGIGMTYSHFSSIVENANFKNALNLHLLYFNYIFHHEYPNGLLYSDLTISVFASGLFRQVNDAPYIYDDTKSKAYGAGGNVNLRFGYHLQLNCNACISPFFALGYAPYLYSPNTEVLINQTKGLTGKNWTGISTTQIGMVFQFKQKIHAM